MQYADYAYYSGTYHGSLVPESQFQALARDAGGEIDRLTFGRLKEGAEPDEAGKNAVCAAVDVLYSWENAEKGRPVGLKSETEGARSVSYDTSAEWETQWGKKLEKAIDRNLPRSHPLRYRGAGRC